MSYTIDLTEMGGTWMWKLYIRGGSERINDGEADTLEQASSDARTAMIVHSRSTP